MASPSVRVNFSTGLAAGRHRSIGQASRQARYSLIFYFEGRLIGAQFPLVGVTKVIYWQLPQRTLFGLREGLPRKHFQLLIVNYRTVSYHLGKARLTII